VRGRHRELEGRVKRKREEGKTVMESWGRGEQMGLG